MSCSYSYLQVNFNQRFDGAVSITVVLKESESKVESLSLRLRVQAPVKPFFLFLYFAFVKKQDFFFAIHMIAEKACFYLLCTCKATSLSKMERLVWRYRDEAGSIIENVYKFCMEENEVWNDTVTEWCIGQDCSTHWR